MNRLEAKVAVILGAAYVLGMFSGWTVVGLLRRSLNRSSELLENRQAHAAR